MNYKILVADDNPEVLELIQFTMESEHYVVITASDGDEAYQKVLRVKPDLVILDVNMPGMSGFEVCQKIRENSDTCLIPVVMLSSLAKTKDRITGIKLGADEYLTKPFETLELVARVGGLLKRAKESLAASPLTGLPGNVSIETEIKNRLNSEEEFYVVYSDLDNFKSFNDKYSFDKGDGVIKLVAAVFRSAVATYGGSNDFLSHIGGDDFIIITSVDRAKLLVSKIIESFDALMPNQYDEQTRRQGYLDGLDRTGNTARFPLMSISFGCVKVSPSKFKHYSQVVENAKEFLKLAKGFKGSYSVFSD